MRELDIGLTPRQVDILARLVEEYVATGAPVGSKTLVQRAEMEVSSSTVRYELAMLEEHGMLTHPHTSAGRVPTDLGYRFYADRLLARVQPTQSDVELAIDLSVVQSQVEAALRVTTDALAELTSLLALVSAPPLETTVVRHVEVLLLQPDRVMVVIITSTGGVTKRLFTFEEAVDPGLAEWSRAYLNERVAGLQLGAHLLRSRFEDPEMTGPEREFLARLRPAFTELVRDEEQTVFVGGTAGLFAEVRTEELDGYRRLLEMLEERAALLEMLRASLVSKRPFVRVGAEIDDTDFAGMALVGAPYGLRTRNLGTVSLLGPARMDYEKAIAAVRIAARELSRFVEDVYED